MTQRIINFQTGQVISTNPTPAPAEPVVLTLDQERAGMNVYARAFFAALKLFPAPPAAHMLEAYQAAVAATGPYDDLRIWDARVTIVIRAHPDMEAFRTAFGLTPQVLDAVFRTALAIERGASQQDIAAAMTVLP